jgi:hypothetical protein
MFHQNQAATNRQNLREVTTGTPERANLRFREARGRVPHPAVQVYLEVEVKIPAVLVLQVGQVPAEERAAVQHQVRIIVAIAAAVTVVVVVVVVVVIAVVIAASRTTQKVLAHQKGDKTIFDL